MQEDLQGSRNGFQIFQDDRCPALGGTSVTSKNAYPQTRRIAHDNLPAQGDNRDMFPQEPSISKTQRILWPVGAGMAGAMLLTALYFGIVSWAESPGHAIDLFWEDRWIVIPIILGFGVQMALYTILKKRLFIPAANPGPSGALTGAGGTTSTLAMIACCAHHVTDVLPILGLTAAATFLADYQTLFMRVGLGTTLVGIAVMLFILFKERKKATQFMTLALETL
jgi:hypothetical protein